jgi:hypothetical protein
LALKVPNIQDIEKRDPKTGEALKKIEAFVNLNVTPAAGNKVAAPTFVNPGRPGG